MANRIPKGIDPERIPRHVACVMDGNGRWATQRGLPRTDGHAAGEEALFDTVDGALDLGLRWLTVYAFSTENWKRPVDEVRYLMGFNERILTDRRDELHGRDVRITFAGRRDWRVPKRLLKRMDEAVELTKNNKTMTLTIAFNYGGRAEVVDAVRQIAAEGIAPEKIDEKTIRDRLYVTGMPDPDLMVRTSGEFRISNFLLWELAYSELVFTDVLWPDFRRENLFDAVRRVSAARTPLRGRALNKNYSDRAVVLRTMPLGEADRIVTLMTEAHGRVRAVAKGIRRTTSKFGSRLEPTTHVSLQLYIGRELDTITQAETIAHMPNTRDDLHRFSRANVMMETVDQVAPEKEPNPALYRMLVGALHRAGRCRRPARACRLPVEVAVAGRLSSATRRLRGLRDC